MCIALFRVTYAVGKNMTQDNNVGNGAYIVYPFSFLAISGCLHLVISNDFLRGVATTDSLE